MTHYEVLGVARTAPTSDLRRAYVALARQHHPDRAGGDADAMRAVNEAWATLRDPGRRALYDLTLRPVSHGAAVGERARTDAEDLLADLDDDTPLGGVVVLPRWLSLMPVAVFVASVIVFGIGVLFASTPSIGVAFALFLVSCTMFLMAPFVALLASRRGG